MSWYEFILDSKLIRLIFSYLKRTFDFVTGSFSPCSVCTNCNVILQNKANKYSKDQRVIVLYVRRLHLLQQARERETLDERRNDARRSKLPNGQPIKAFIFGDAFTQGKGDTMKDGVGYQQHSSEDPVISNRIIAYEG